MSDIISVNKKDIEKLIAEADVTVETQYEKVTVVCVKLQNGFVITEASGAVDTRNYSLEMGKKICLDRIKNKLWELEGYALQKKVYEDQTSKEITVRKDMTFGLALEAMKAGHRLSRKGWNGKDQFVFLAHCDAMSTDADMSAYQEKGVGVCEMLVIKTAQDVLQPGWLASQSDMLSEDWYIVE